MAGSLLLHLFFQRHQRSACMVSALEGLKAASVGLIMAAGATILLLTFFGTFDWHLIEHLDATSLIIFIFIIALFILRKWKMNPILLMLLTGGAGYIMSIVCESC